MSAARPQQSPARRAGGIAVSPALARSAARHARDRSESARLRARSIVDTSRALVHPAPGRGPIVVALPPAPAARAASLSHLLSGPAPVPARRRVADLVEEHLALADSIARSMTPMGQSREDFVQVGRLALVEAARRYDAHRGVPFVGYAHAVIRGYLKHHLRDRVWAVRPPRRLQELWLDVHPARERLAQQLGRAPSIDELSRELGEDPATVHSALGVQNAWAADSIDVAVEARREPAVCESGFDRIEDRSWLRPAVQALPERLQLVLELRFTHEFTQQQIAERIGCSQMHVSRLLAKALSELRTVAAAD